MCVCVCVCAWQREKKRERKRVREYGRVCACERVCERLDEEIRLD